MSAFRQNQWFLLSSGAIAAALLVGIAVVSFAQTEQHINNAAMQSQHAWKASDLIGQKVYSSDDQEKGKIKDLMIEPDGKVAYAAVSFGGFLGMGDKLFAVPLDAIHLEWKDNKLEHARVDVTEENIKQRQGFDDSHWPERSDHGFASAQQR